MNDHELMTDYEMLIDLLSRLTAPPTGPKEPVSVLTIMREEDVWHLSIPGDKASFKLPECAEWVEASDPDLSIAVATLLDERLARKGVA